MERISVNKSERSGMCPQESVTKADREYKMIEGEGNQRTKATRIMEGFPADVLK